MPINKTRIRQIIQQLNRVDLNRVSDDYLAEQVSLISDRMEMRVRKAGATDMLFRVRVNPPQRPRTSDELGAPPAHVVTGYQRCNPPGVPMFYGASRRITAIKECRVKAGDIFYLSQWGPHSYYPVNLLFDSRIGIGPESDSNSEFVCSYFDTLMTRPIHDSFSNQYKITSAIAQGLTKNFSPAESSDVAADGLIALFYPSVFDPENSFNVAMHASFARERLGLLHVTEIVAIASGAGLEFRALNNARPKLGGALEWTNSPDKLPELRRHRDAAMFINWGGVAAMPYVDEPVEDGYLRKLLEETLDSPVLPEFPRQ